ncbi:UNVERIFIED_CONTAM: hypothetical protein Sindi_0921800 [Sesamum indicum]
MKGGDQCSRVFFRKISQRRSARRILQINDDQGTTQTEPGAVINEFVTYYQNILGRERRHDVIDLRFLRPWARHIISDEDANSLLLPFTTDDVRQAVFDIAEDKAPRPDGYSSGFFKAAWTIVGQEVSLPVLDFFNTGRLLKQINTTLLALIPKPVPSGVCAWKKHTTTPHKTHTNFQSMHEAADDLADDEDGLADEENIEEGRGSPKPAGAGEKQAVSGDKEDEQVDLVFPAFDAGFSPAVKSLTIGEENNIDSVANAGGLKEKSIAFSQISKLGFSKTKEARGNSTPNLTGFPSGDGSFGVVRVDTSMPKEKGCILTSDNEVTSAPPYLGFSATNLEEEDEASNGASRRNHGSNTSQRVYRTNPMATGGNLRSEDDNIMRRPNLGFRGAPPIDEKSMKALEELKIKWNKRFGGAATNRYFPPPVAQPKEPELVRGLRKAIRCLVPLSKMEKTTGILGENSRSTAGNTRTPDSDGLPETEKATGRLEGKVGADMDSRVAGEVAQPLSTDDVSPRSSADVSPGCADVSPKSAADVSPKSAHDMTWDS